MYRVWTMSKEQAIGKPRSSSLGGSGPRSRRLILPDDPFYRGHDRSYLLPRIPGGYISKSTLLHDSISRLHGRRGNLVRTFSVVPLQSICPNSSSPTPVYKSTIFRIKTLRIETRFRCRAMVSPFLLYTLGIHITKTYHNLSYFSPALPALPMAKQIKSLERQGYTVLYARDDWSESTIL
jgi:hypothetical protein